MNLANKITLFRVVLIPFFLVVLLSGTTSTSRYIALAIFIIAALSDFVDGYIARSRNMITNFGKFADPLADKLLVSAALIALVGLSQLDSWVVIIIISREFIVTGFRLVAADKKVIAASMWGKLKTATQMVMVSYLLLDLKGTVFEYVGTALVWLAVIFTVISGVDYIVKNIDVLKEER